MDYFQKLFTSSTSTHASAALDEYVPMVTNEMNIAVTKPVTTEEIKRDVFIIKRCSAGVFYQTYLEIIGSQVTSEIKIFLRGSFPHE